MSGEQVQVVPVRGREFTAYSGTLVTETCYSCGILFAFPAEWKANRLEARDSWYCPNGHGQVYLGKTEEDLLREQVASKQRELDGALDQLTKTEKERRRIIKRVEAGVCIHCNRTFENLARHMETQHLDTAAESGDEHPKGIAALTQVTYVHKARHRFAQDYHRDGMRSVYCWAQRIHYTKTAMRWIDVTCPECRKAGGLPA